MKVILNCKKCGKPYNSERPESDKQLCPCCVWENDDDTKIEFEGEIAHVY